MKMGMSMSVAWLKGLPAQCPGMAKRLATPLVLATSTVDALKHENLVHVAYTIGELQHSEYLKPTFLDQWRSQGWAFAQPSQFLAQPSLTFAQPSQVV